MKAEASTYFRHGEYRIDHLTHISRRHRVVYLEVPKTGCTVIKRVLQHSESGGTQPSPGVSVHQRDASPLGAPLRDGFDLDELFGEHSTWLTFAFVRNPYSRLLSCYLDKIGPPPRRSYRDVKVHNLGLAPDDKISFREFLERVSEQPKRKMDIHWSPQTRLTGWGKISLDFIGRFESFEADLRRLMTVSGVTAPDELITRRAGHATDAHRRLDEYYSDDRCATLVREIYAGDFDAFGYGRDVRFA